MTVLSRMLVVLLLLAAVAVSANGQTITVTNVEDVRDAGYEATIEDLPGPDGLISFAEAMIAANNTPGHQTIGFGIPANELSGGRAYLQTGGGVGIRAFEATTIDGTTQTAFTGDTNPDGAEVAFFPGVIYLNANDCTFVGIDSGSVNVNGSNSLVRDNTNMGGINLYSGSGTLIENNTGGTIKIDRSNDNVVVGNTIQRVRVLGWVGGGLPALNNRIGGPKLGDRNFITGYGTWDSEGFPSGTTVQIFDSIGTLVENNWIGTTPDGMASGSFKSTVGVGFEGENRDAVILNNRIAGILGLCGGTHCEGQVFGRAIYFNGEGSGYAIVGNTIGLDANDEPTLGSVFGIDVGYFNFSGITGVQIGGTAPREGNIIAGHLFNGVTVQRDVTDVRISGNSIYANQGLGIDLVPTNFGYGVTPNDPLDADSGGNGLQNFPDVLHVSSKGRGLRVAGSLHSEPHSDYTLEFFAAPDCDPSGFGEGQLFLGSTSVTTNSAGNADFRVKIHASVPAGWVVTSTATREPNGATSEFSACVP